MISRTNLFPLLKLGTHSQKPFLCLGQVLPVHGVVAAGGQRTPLCAHAYGTGPASVGSPGPCLQPWGCPAARKELTWRPGLCQRGRARGCFCLWPCQPERRAAESRMAEQGWGRRPRVFNFLQQSFRGIWHFSSGLKAQPSVSPSLPAVLVLLCHSLCEVWRVGFGGTVSVGFGSTRLEKAQKSLHQARVCRGEVPVECRLFPGGFNTKLRIVKSKNNICEIH